jgi:hypothetical protein
MDAVRITLYATIEQQIIVDGLILDTGGPILLSADISTSSKLERKAISSGTVITAPALSGVDVPACLLRVVRVSASDETISRLLLPQHYRVVAQVQVETPRKPTATRHWAWVGD